MKQTLQNLIAEGNQISFKDNSRTSVHGIFSDASGELLAWVSRVEDYVVSNYNEESGPYKLYETFNRNHLSGFYQADFENEIKKLLAVLKSCETISPNKIVQKDDNAIISLIKNYLFWTVLVIAVGGAYKLGFDNGNSRFDKEKIELNKENEILKVEKQKADSKTSEKDSIIIELKAKLKVNEKERTTANSRLAK